MTPSTTARGRKLFSITCAVAAMIPLSFLVARYFSLPPHGFLGSILPALCTLIVGFLLIWLFISNSHSTKRNDKRVSFSNLLVGDIVFTLFILAVCGTLAMRFSSPYRHQRELEHKLPFFEQVISDLRKAEVTSASVARIPVPDHARNLVYSIHAQHLADGSFAVLFLTGGGVPAKHRGFLFLSAGDITNYPEMAQWPKRTSLRDQWLYVGN